MEETGNIKPQVINPVEQLPLQYASPLQRFLAFIIDMAILVFIWIDWVLISTFVSGLFPQFFGISRGWIEFIFGVFLITFTLLYEWIMISLFQTTPGKYILRLRVRQTNNQEIGTGRVFIREIIGKYFLFLIITPFIGYGTLLFTKKRQGVHDLVAHTVVVRERKDLKMPSFVTVIFVALGFILTCIFVNTVVSERVMERKNQGLEERFDTTPF